MMKKVLLFISFFCFTYQFSQIQLEQFATAVSNPVEIVASPNGDNRIFVVQQTGTIKIINPNGSVESNNLLDITSKVKYSGEMGLLGLAFHPQFTTNGYFFVYYNDLDKNIQVSRFTANTNNLNTADPSSEKKILNLTKPFTNHNGGSIHFGRDGYLWISTGDGGGEDDPNNNAQNKNVLLGKLLRLDIDTENAYNIPPDNPFVGTDGADEIWAYGLRNAWKFSFDKTTNDIWIADVGQGAFEEINKFADTSAGINYGWRCYEGNQSHITTGCDNASTMTFPVAQYDHSGGKCSITGGYVYRGNLYTDIIGKYIFAEFCSRQIGILENDNSITWSTAFAGNNFTTFGEDNQKQLYVAVMNGTIFKVTTPNMAIADVEKSKITIYPNPAKNTIYFSNINTKNTVIELIDLSGRIVKKAKLDTNSFDVSKIEKGTYIVNLKSENLLLKTHKIIIE